MSRFIEPSAEMVLGWTEQISKFPDNVREVAESFDPFCLYMLRDGQIGSIGGFGLDDQQRVCVNFDIQKRFNPKNRYESRVFGVLPEEATVWDVTEEKKIVIPFKPKITTPPLLS